ncbi:Tripeptidyl aminopeptidase OS=Streptomyces microflavus OX=1919 GN=Smic_25910 PE=4 SV=1 [Streptomyces microflavus]
MRRRSGLAAVRGGETGNEDIKDRILAIPGTNLIEEKPYAGYRYFVLDYTQPVDHRRPSRGMFQQRITVLHKDTARPDGLRHQRLQNARPTRAAASRRRSSMGNQVSLEYRFFTPSRPAPADWTKLDIWQVADDQHRVFTALEKVYPKNGRPPAAPRAV